MSARDQLASEAKIGNVSFYATSASGPGAPRRIVQYTGVGVDGAVTEDMGADARQETLQATIDEDVFLKLKEVKDTAKVVTAVHPLFGVMDARVINIEYEANARDMVDVTITLVEHGTPAILLAPKVISLASAAQNAKSAFDDLSGDLDDLDDFDLGDNLTSSIGSMNSQWSLFDSVLDSALSGDVLIDDMAAAFSDIAKAGQGLIDAAESAYNDVAELVAYPIQDTIYELIDAGRDVVNSLERQATDVWQEVTAVGSVSIEELALEYFGVDADLDDAIQKILDRNPQIIDVSAVIPGTELSIPIV